ncbi:NAD-dependent epimerase/dehydratase family protein [Nonomuraea sp. LPB2021202275-12-8]|uniref:NAD-dependent epimerase/dehydratase family protein n=1 Tax=Nonomuraea sp. LPB2021202275-12-8 TaxID=3120159 RepID=UPI00300D08AD
MKVLVVGGSAFLGRAVVEEAMSRGHEVTTFNRGRSGADVPGVEAVRGDREVTADLRRPGRAGGGGLHRAPALGRPAVTGDGQLLGRADGQGRSGGPAFPPGRGDRARHVGVAAADPRGPALLRRHQSTAWRRRRRRPFSPPGPPALRNPPQTGRGRAANVVGIREVAPSAHGSPRGGS